jgi:hypothetical protein
MYLIKYKQPYVAWHPPDWPVEREIAMGEQVAELGKADFRKRFRKRHWLPQRESQPNAQQTPYSDGERGFTIPVQPAAPKKRKWSDILSIMAAILILAFGVVFALPNHLLALISGAILCLINYLWYLASLGLAVARYDRWLNRCLARYRASRSRT